MTSFERTSEELRIIAAMEGMEDKSDAPAAVDGAPPGGDSPQPMDTAPSVAPIAPSATPAATDAGKPVAIISTPAKPLSCWDRTLVVRDKPYTLPNSLKELGAKHPPLVSLIDMLAYCRPAGSRGEKRLIGKYIWTLGARPDKFGNFWLRVGKEGASRILWSCHTDTVHRRSGFQPLALRGDDIMSLSNDCLGADCATGVWLMCEMIKAGVPGTYAFHRGEERGGQGSSYIKKSMAEYLTKHFDYAIAFDRRGTDSVITHQGSRLGASPEFVASIVPLLPNGYRADNGGTFTDTANYVDLIKECSNLSVGYYCQHMANEHQDAAHALALRNAMIIFDESKLVAVRDPAKKEYYSYSYDYGRANNEYARTWGDGGWTDYSRRHEAHKKDYAGKVTSITDETARRAALARRQAWDRDYYHAASYTGRMDTIEAIVKKHPARLADFIEQLGYDPISLAVALGLPVDDDPNDTVGY